MVEQELKQTPLYDYYIDKGLKLTDFGGWALPIQFTKIQEERRKEKRGVSKPRGRKPAKTLQEYKYENKRLKMENELLRDFLSLTERK